MLVNGSLYIQPEVSHFTAADYVVSVSTLVLSAVIGVYHAYRSRRQLSMENYMLGERKMGVLPAAASLAVTSVSAIAVVANPVEVYVFGTHYMTTCIAILLTIPISAFLFVPVFRNIQGISMYEYLEARFNRNVRTMASVTYIVVMLGFLPTVTYAPSLALSQVTGLDLWFCVLSVGLICTFYSSIGGFKAVIWTDVFQTVILLTATFLLLVKGVHNAGGLRNMWMTNLEGKRIDFFNTTPDATVRHTVWSTVFGGLVFWTGLLNTNQSVIQRYFTLPSLRKAQVAVMLGTCLIAIIIFSTSFVGLLVYSAYSDCDPISTGRVSRSDQLMPLYVMDTLGFLPGLPGLIVAGIFSASLSSFSSVLNALAAVTVQDIVLVYCFPKMTDRWATWMAKMFTALYGAICLALVAIIVNAGHILQVAIIILAVVMGPLLGVFLLGICIPSANSKGAIVGLVASVALSLWISLGSLSHPRNIPRPPVSVEGCITVNTTQIQANFSRPTLNVSYNEDSETFILYRLSYLFHTTFGCLGVIVLGTIISYITGANRGVEVDPRLISPFISKLQNSVKSRSKKAKVECTEDECMKPESQTTL